MTCTLIAPIIDSVLRSSCFVSFDNILSNNCWIISLLS